MRGKTDEFALLATTRHAATLPVLSRESFGKLKNNGELFTGKSMIISELTNS